MEALQLLLKNTEALAQQRAQQATQLQKVGGMRPSLHAASALRTQDLAGLQERGLAREVLTCNTGLLVT